MWRLHIKQIHELWFLKCFKANTICKQDLCDKTLSHFNTWVIDVQTYLSVILVRLLQDLFRQCPITNQHWCRWTCPRTNWQLQLCFIYVATRSSVSRQDEPNSTLWLATKQARCCYLAHWGQSTLSCKNLTESHIMNPLFTKSLFGQDGWKLALFSFGEFRDLKLA